MSAWTTLFAEPAMLLPGLLLAAVAAGALVFSVRRRAARSAALVSPALAAKAGLAPAGGFPAAGAVLTLLVALGLGGALARPRWGKTAETAQRRGADVVFVLDTSASMRAADVSPSRFVLARQAAQSLLSRLGSDRAALIACEGEAQALVPLTLDAAAVGLFLDAMEPGMGAKPGTSLASGLAAAADLFPAGSAGGRNAVVFSDGEDLEGGVDAAIARAKAEGITVHAVFVGALGGTGAPVPEVDAAGRTSGFKSDASGQPVLSKADPELLRRLAAQTGGSFTVVSPGRTDLEGVARQIDLGARRPLSEVLVTSLEERFQIPLGVAVGALGLLLLGVGRGRSVSRGAKAPGFVRNLLRKGKRDAAELGVAAALLLALVVAARTEAQQPAPAAPAIAPLAPPSASSNGAAAPALPGAQASPDATAPLPFLSRIFSSPRSEAKKGQQALDEKKPGEAVGHFQQEIALDPRDATGSYNLGTAQSRAGRPGEALTSLERARKEGRGAVAADAAFNTGQTLYREKQYEPAAAAFREALKRRPGDADAAWNYELCVRRAEEEKQKQKEQQKEKKDQKDDRDKTGGKDGKDKQQAGSDAQKKQQQEKEFEQKANMTRDKAEQLLSAIERSDLEEQKKKIAEQRSKRRVARDW
jgi:Ca-activated chloride channel family protein